MSEHTDADRLAMLEARVTELERLMRERVVWAVADRTPGYYIERPGSVERVW